MQLILLLVIILTTLLVGFALFSFFKGEGDKPMQPRPWPRDPPNARIFIIVTIIIVLLTVYILSNFINSIMII